MQTRSVVLETSAGPITVELYLDHAPRTCKNFAELSARGYYNNVKFHRVIPDFMIQGGDPTGTGRGGASIYGEKFADEIHPQLKHTGAGILSMANSGPNTNGSQFFITLAPTPWLDGKHTIFGRVSQGMTIVKRIGMVPTDNMDRPKEDIVIRKAVCVCVVKLRWLDLELAVEHGCSPDLSDAEEHRCAFGFAAFLASFAAQLILEDVSDFSPVSCNIRMLNMHDLEASLSNTKIPQHSRNGHHFLQLEGMNASSNDPSAPQSTTSSHDVLASHLYHLGFVQGWFSDLHIRVQGFSGSASPSGGSWPQLSSGNGPVKSNASDPSTADVGSAPPNGASNGSPAGASQTSLFNHSFNSAQFQDGVLFKLHKIVAIRSPYLASLIQESEVRRPENFSGPTEIVLPISEPNLTPEGLSIAFGHLYANYSHGILSGIHTQPNPDVIDVPTVHRRSAVLRGVLLAASLLQLSDLAAAATEFIRQDLTRLSAPQYCRFVSQPPVLPATPTGSSGQADASASAALSSRMSEIREALYAFLSRGLVRELVKRYGVPIKWGSKDHESYRELVSAFADLPFEWLKRVVESKDDFEVPSDMERFSFAKDVVSLRAKQKQQNPSLLLAGEENVLLAFGGGKAGGSGVTIVRKAPKASPVHIGQQQLLQQHHSGFHQPSAPQQRMPYPSMPHHQHQANSQPHDMLGPFGFGQLYNGVDSNTAPNGTAHAGDDYRLQSSGSERKIWKASV